MTQTAADHTAAREQLLDAAIAANKFPASRRTRYAALYDTNPTYAANLIASMGSGVPTGGVTASTRLPDAIAHRSLLSDTERRRVIAAESGEYRQVTRIDD